MDYSEDGFPQLRKDPVIGRWVIISTDRAKRPTDWKTEQEVKTDGFCPFCPGNESKTPPEVFALRDGGSKPNSTGWRVRVVSNKFPALQIEGHLNRRGEGIYDMMRGIGAHEVLIENPEHSIDLAALPVEHIRDVFWSLKERICDLRKDERFHYILAFKNHGKAAGASLEHSHLQIIATPIVPKRVQEELSGAKKYYDYKERCIFCDIIRQEKSSGVRVVSDFGKFITIEPFAARFPFETWLLPCDHQSKFEDIQEDDLSELAGAMKETLLRLNKTLDFPPYNFIIHTSPQLGTDFPEYHWHFEIIPKLTKVAGFEWGSGFYINATPPELAAECLRNASID